MFVSISGTNHKQQVVKNKMIATKLTLKLDASYFSKVVSKFLIHLNKKRSRYNIVIVVVFVVIVVVVVVVVTKWESRVSIQYKRECIPDRLR